MTTNRKPLTVLEVMMLVEVAKQHDPRFAIRKSVRRVKRKRNTPWYVVITQQIQLDNTLSLIKGGQLCVYGVHPIIHGKVCTTACVLGEEAP